MDNIKAIFFDNDNTITHENTAATNRYHKIVENLSGKPFREDNATKFFIFDKLFSMGLTTDTYDNEINFFKAYYKFVLLSECGRKTPEIDLAANEIFNIMWRKEKILYSDVLPTFKRLKESGYKIGIISDAHHSLATGLSTLGAIEYIDTCTSSSEIKVQKPCADIYYHAIHKLGLSPNECIYVDDNLEDALGAASIGFTTFRINRTGADIKEGDIPSLFSVLDYLNISYNEDETEIENQN